MRRRLPCGQVRTSIQLGILTFIVLLFIFILDNRYSVLPSKLHNQLPQHHPGLVLTDITIATCSSLNLLSSCQLDPEKWHRVEKDLYLSAGWVTRAYIHVERKREGELLDTDRVILDIRIGRLDPATAEKDQGSARWEARPGGIWLLRTSKRHASDSTKAITAVDILFGADAVDPRPGWEIKDQALLIGANNDVPEPRLSFRRGVPPKSGAPQPRVRKDGKFKIMQVADLHLSTGLGTCRDAEPPSPSNVHCDADPRTLEFIGLALDSEKPDLVVLTGDQVNGETSPDAQTSVFKFAELLIKRKIPYAAIFGNHDDEGSLDRSGLMSLTESLPLSLSQAGPATVDGIGNYAIDILARGTSSHSAITLYLLDTHGYSPDETHFKGYDWIKPSQIQWFHETARKLKNSAAHKEYAHIHLNMAFIHIPLPEYRDQLSNIIPDSGEYRESVTAPGFNSRFADALIEENVLSVSCGHDHANDYCLLNSHSDPESVSKTFPHAADGKLWMCYGGGSGFGGYGGYGGYRRRVRVWEVDTGTAIVRTWKRVENGVGEMGGRIGELVVVEGGRVVGG
ncbi:hypothetical protein MMC09_001449 [Bachmanniomyces sp. S44760]|nr:hypothetical protein [Bachmanniomyces sp. S44760]